ncbi:hypothetical protein Pla100_60600 [Neorhodopirellula pilleata]|uniref:Uncharacterized protein n=1 Tax=Neorhodopirellula pilleata TaxID=2714738 RepID=A0A5C5ZH42_9BACT|nr:hypothetical protein Pla100_60600 [Neorhodopirellula pilleata]
MTTVTVEVHRTSATGNGQTAVTIGNEVHIVLSDRPVAVGPRDRVFGCGRTGVEIARSTQKINPRQHDVALGTTIEIIDSSTRDDDVVATFTINVVAALTNIDRVVARTTSNRIVAAAGRDRVVARLTVDRVATVSGCDRVVARTTVNDMTAVAGHDHVITAVAKHIDAGIPVVVDDRVTLRTTVNLIDVSQVDAGKVPVERTSMSRLTDLDRIAGAIALNLVHAGQRQIERILQHEQAAGTAEDQLIIADRSRVAIVLRRVAGVGVVVVSAFATVNRVGLTIVAGIEVVRAIATEQIVNTCVTIDRVVATAADHDVIACSAAKGIVAAGCRMSHHPHAGDQRSVGGTARGGSDAERV